MSALKRSTKNRSTYLVKIEKKEIGNGIFNGTDADARKD
jgi:hypothetical protein